MAARSDSSFQGRTPSPVKIRERTVASATGAESREIDAYLELTVCDRSVLLTVIYADLFDFPLTRDEVFDRLIGQGFRLHELSASLERLQKTYLSCEDGHIFLQGRGRLVGLREGRRQRADELWNEAIRYARWLARVPFIRMVAVSGSLAVDNSNGSSDVDLFCVTEARRLWFARLFIVPLSKLTRLLPSVFPLYLCPNYVLSLTALRIEDRNLFTAHEVLQAVPLFGRDVCMEFVQQNEWALGLLPNLHSTSRHPSRCELVKPYSTRRLERIFGGRAGNVLNDIAYRTFTGFYRWRARRNGWDWTRLEPAYQLERYTVPEGGYVSVIAGLFRSRVQEVMNESLATAEIDRLFPNRHHPFPVCYDWETLFHTEYGAGIPGAS